MGRRRITVDLDEALIHEMDRAATSTRRSRNQFLSDAVKESIRLAERRAVDEAFAAMANDPDYQALLIEVEQDMWAGSDMAWRHIDAAEKADRSA